MRPSKIPGGRWTGRRPPTRSCWARSWLANPRLLASRSSSTTRGARESAALRTYLSSLIEHVSGDLDPTPEEPKRFYSGFDLGWYPYVAGLDVVQQVAKDLRQSIVAGEGFIPRTRSPS